MLTPHTPPRLKRCFLTTTNTLRTFPTGTTSSRDRSTHTRVPAQKYTRVSMSINILSASVQHHFYWWSGVFKSSISSSSPVSFDLKEILLVVHQILCYLQFHLVLLSVSDCTLVSQPIPLPRNATRHQLVNVSRDVETASPRLTDLYGSSQIILTVRLIELITSKIDPASLNWQAGI